MRSDSEADLFIAESCSARLSELLGGAFLSDVVEESILVNLGCGGVLFSGIVYQANRIVE